MNKTREKFLNRFYKKICQVYLFFGVGIAKLILFSVINNPQWFPFIISM